MKVQFIRDCEIRDPKTRGIVSAFKKDEAVDLSEAGAAHFIANGDAVAADAAPIAEATGGDVGAGTIQVDAEPASDDGAVGRKKSRF